MCYIINPNWHELRKEENCSSLAQFLYDSMSFAGCQINPIDVNFQLQKRLEIFDKTLADKIGSKKDKGVETALPHDN